MNDPHYQTLSNEWESKQADIIADLEYNKNLADHLVITEVMISKFNSILSLIDIDENDMRQWQILGYSMFSLYHRILNLIPDFTSKQRGQLLALSRENIKEERFHNDVILKKDEQITEAAFLDTLKSYTEMIAAAIITADRDLQIIMKKPILSTISGTAIKFSREVESHGLNFRNLLLYDLKDIKLIPTPGTEIFVKPLS